MPVHNVETKKESAMKLFQDMRPILFLLCISILFWRCNSHNFNKVEAINRVLNDKLFYENLSTVVRDQRPYVVENEFLNKKEITELHYRDQKVMYSKIDSSNLNSFKSNWKSPKFYIECSIKHKEDNLVQISVLIRSVGFECVYTLDDDLKSTILERSFGLI
ncbi:hypothetical protein GVN16_10450 [Emticicia sp. CRIBPO]|uniref:hypothetical protein n=1 Tax=Emticicia sp. CRIBPO TaxID=2683258 RepID=UPI0014135938|nr:hypothetical protein [Emticicia sp. CRIBPO]NBA86183.1 hypothetical protein [Emticicia sp. CRIBPO]